jgi:hypothetical protein
MIISDQSPVYIYISRGAATYKLAPVTYAMEPVSEGWSIWILESARVLYLHMYIDRIRVTHIHIDVILFKANPSTQFCTQ